MNMHDIGLRISALRKERDMTQLELADKLGVSYQAVSSWERGLTMPDIAKLPDISQVLATTIDELLGNPQQATAVHEVLNQQTPALEAAALEELAPILKPSQVDALAHSTAKPISLRDIAGLAPFISKEALGQLANQAVGSGNLRDIAAIAPFMGREFLDPLARRISDVGSIRDLSGIAPFISKDILGELAEKAAEAGSWNDINAIAPFVDKELLSRLVLRAAATPAGNGEAPSPAEE